MIKILYEGYDKRRKAYVVVEEEGKWQRITYEYDDAGALEETTYAWNKNLNPNLKEYG